MADHRSLLSIQTGAVGGFMYSLRSEAGAMGGPVESGVQTLYHCLALAIIFLLGGAVAAYVKGLQGGVRKMEKSLSDYKLYVAEHYARKEFLSDLKREITESIRDLGRRIDHVFHPDRD